ncbi:MAG: AAA family ATPase [Planctomycetota bacterium]|nr:AAA family ATPase [Planctomycetaceae bacterium]MDQ3332709.1 AAA family ATPase [Planctomycetota bacterium]
MLSAPHSATPAHAARTPNGGLDVTTVLRSLRRRWAPCVFLGVPLAVVCGLAAFFFLPAPYVAIAEVYFKSYDDNLVFDTNEPQADFRVRKETHQRLVTSRDVLTAALRKLDVSAMKTFVGIQNPVEWLAENVSVRRAGDEFFTISLSGEEAKEIADIVNAVAGSYMSEVVEADVVKRRERLAELQKVIDGVEEDLKMKQEELRRLTEMTSSASSEQSSQKQNFVLEMQIEIRKQITQVEMALLQMRIRERVLGDAPKDDAKDELVPEDVLQNLLAREPAYADAKSRVDQMKRFVTATENRVAAGHRSIADARKRLELAEAELQQTALELKPVVLKQIEIEQKSSNVVSEQDLPNEIESLEKARAELDRELEQWKVTEQETGLYSLQIADATKELGRLEALNETLTTELERREFELKNARLPARIIEDAIAPTTRSFKKKLAGVGGAAGIALALVIGGFTALDMRGGRISTRQEISDTLSLPIIATIPALPNSAMSPASGSRRSRQKTIFWTSALKESIDAARTMLLSLAERDGMKTIMISSAMPSEGKTTLSLHLATSLARSGRRVILVDADLRRPSLSQVYGAEGPGVCEVIRGESTIDEVIVSGNIEGLSILPAGEFDEEVLERVALNGFGPALTELREQWDFVIIDSSPVLPICDGLLFATHVDGVIFAIRRDVSRRSLVAAALDRFRSVGKPVLGAVAIGLHDDPAGYSEMRRYQNRYGYSRALAEC